MRLNVIIPYSRPEMIPNIIENFNKQKFFDKKLIIIENGPAINTFPKNIGAIILTSENHQSKARNVGINYLDNKEPWVTMDDDDWYGEEYLKEFEEGFNDGYEVLGKSRRYVWLSDGIYCHKEGAKYFTGGAIGSIHNINFPIINIGEDVVFHIEAEKNHFKTKLLSDKNYIYRRNHTHKHTWTATDNIVLRAMPGEWTYMGTDPDNLNPQYIKEPTNEEIFTAMMELP